MNENFAGGVRHLRRSRLTLFGFLIIASSLCNAQAVIVIDDFSTDQAQIFDTSVVPGVNSSSWVAGSMLGGERDLQVDLTGQSPFTMSGVQDAWVGSGALASYNQDLNSGVTDVVYDGPDGMPAVADLNATGLGSVDLTRAGSIDGILLRTLQTDFSTEIDLLIHTDDGNSSVARIGRNLLCCSAGRDFFVPFSAFRVDVGLGADFSNIGAIDVRIEQPSGGSGTVIDFIQAAPSLAATTTDALGVDIDGDGRASPGDTIRYTVVVTNPDDFIDAATMGVVIDANVDANASLMAGTVTSSQGSVSVGNTPGDTRVRVDLGDLADGVSVTVNYDVRIALPVDSAVTSISAQVVVSSPSLPGGIVSDDPDDPSSAMDATVTAITRSVIGDFVWNDIDGDGVQDGGAEIGIPGVSLDVHADLNGNGAIDVGEPRLASVNTDANGNYSLGLPNYTNFIVDVTDTGGVTTGAVLTGGTDPMVLGVAPGNTNDAADFGYRYAQTTDTAVSSQSPQVTVVGEPYLVSATVTASTSSPQGNLRIRDGALGSPSCGPVPLVPGVSPSSAASCQLISTSAGMKLLTVDYEPSTGFVASSGTSLHQVNAAATAISVSGPPGSRINTPTIFSFALSVDAPGAGSPAGTVTLSSDASSCQVTLPAVTASCPLTFTTLGARTVSASFAPADGNFLPAASSGAANAQTVVYALADIAVTKTDTVATYRPGDLLVYTVNVRNLGADSASHLRLTDRAPAGLIDTTWSCDSSGGAVCPATGGSGDLNAVLVDFPVGALLSYTFFGNVAGSPAQIANTALVELPSDGTVIDPVPANNSATDIDLLDGLFDHGFESALINRAAGSDTVQNGADPSTADGAATVVHTLDDAKGEVVRVYARRFHGQVQFALALRDGQGYLRLGEWRNFSDDPRLIWSASASADGWVLDSVDLL